MADSSSTSEKPPIQKLGLGLLIPDNEPSDPVASNVMDVEVKRSESPTIAPDVDDDPPAEGEVEVMDDDDSEQEAQLLDAIERQVRQLTIDQAEIEAGHKILQSVGGWDDNDWKTEEREYVDEEKGEQDENEDEEGDEENADVYAPGVSPSKGARYNNLSFGRRNVTYPIRPDAEDCAYYMKYWSCKFGSNCKFNHPPPPRRRNQGIKERGTTREENSEREGQIECKYYLSEGGCKYGKDCKYVHRANRTSMSHTPELNFLGLPIRLGEKECPYYLRTGSCKYGSNCRFHHPEPTSVTVGDSPSGFNNGGSLPSQHISTSSVSSWSSPRTYNDVSPFLPYPPTHQGAPPPNSEWNGYQAAAYPTSERTLPTPPAFVINNLPTEMNFPMQRQHDFIVDEYPERPGQPECSYFLKTGDCKYKSSCKYHHPKSRTSKARANPYVLNDKGLPLRPDQPVCTHYHRYGICKYGPACRYDHPLNPGTFPPPFDQKPFGDFRNVDGPGKFRQGNESRS
ncbi:zinc finger CCCH domain-containing protein 67 [Dorcoceras hygrometricum]|uniref:Zinc finger CCCH domain-containing protein 67 n=1 Tax=Dorcoceras hygrometricum TaxID=472368 RepID=A0A2Z7AVE2_9LAMI|nr:zinc finger CCCH domain-containing protein 67 [Dorcoceras hygrometricum]